MSTSSVPSPSSTEIHRNEISNTNLSQSPNAASLSPTQGELEDLLFDCRYGELDSVRDFVERYSVDALASARDERQNNVLHMCAANGHDDILAYILSLPSLPPPLLTSGNDAGNTPLHWACLNQQLSCAKRLVAFKPPSLVPPPSGNSAPNASQVASHALGLGLALILARNKANQTPLGEAERSGWEEGARWLVGVMDLDLASGSSSGVEKEAEGEVEGEDSIAVDKGGINGGTGEEVASHDGTSTESGVEVKLAGLRVSEDGDGAGRSRS